MSNFEQVFGISDLAEYLTALDDALFPGPRVDLTVCGGASMM